MDTSKQAYETASDNYVRAYNAVAAARKALADAEQDFYLATEELARHEAKPGIPLYAAQA